MSVDRYFGAVKLLMHMDDVAFTDVIGHPVTPFNNVSISTTQSKFGGASAYFDGVDDYLIVGGDQSDWVFGIGDFTVEAWVYYLGGRGRITNRQPGGLAGTWSLMFDTDVSFTEVVVGEPGLYFGNSLPQNAWTHVAFSRRDGELMGFENGVMKGSVAFNNNLSYMNDLWIGRTAPDENFFFNLYLDDLRITKGAARYTSSFTPPNAPFPDTGLTVDASIILSSGPVINKVLFLFEGNHRIRGTVRLESAVAPARRVLLYDPKSMRPIAQTFADANGQYEFSGIKPGTYLVVGQDRLTKYHPDIVRVQSEPM